VAGAVDGAACAAICWGVALYGWARCERDRGVLRRAKGASPAVFAGGHAALTSRLSREKRSGWRVLA